MGASRGGRGNGRHQSRGKRDTSDEDVFLDEDEDLEDSEDYADVGDEDDDTEDDIEDSEDNVEDDDDGDDDANDDNDNWFKEPETNAQSSNSTLLEIFRTKREANPGPQRRNKAGKKKGSRNKGKKRSKGGRGRKGKKVKNGKNGSKSEKNNSKDKNKNKNKQRQKQVAKKLKQIGLTTQPTQETLLKGLCVSEAVERALETCVTDLVTANGLPKEFEDYNSYYWGK